MVPLLVHPKPDARPRRTFKNAELKSRRMDELERTNIRLFSVDKTKITFKLSTDLQFLDDLTHLSLKDIWKKKRNFGAR